MNRRCKKGQDISGRVMILDTYGVVQVDSFSRLNGTRLALPEVLEVLNGQKDTAYGFHKIDSDNSYFWSGYYASAIVEDSQVIGVALFSESIADVVSNINSIKQNYSAISCIAVLVVALISISSPAIFLGRWNNCERARLLLLWAILKSGFKWTAKTRLQSWAARLTR